MKKITKVSRIFLILQFFIVSNTLIFSSEREYRLSSAGPDPDAAYHLPLFFNPSCILIFYQLSRRCKSITKGSTTVFSITGFPYGYECEFGSIKLGTGGHIQVEFKGWGSTYIPKYYVAEEIEIYDKAGNYRGTSWSDEKEKSGYFLKNFGGPFFPSGVKLMFYPVVSCPRKSVLYFFGEESTFNFAESWLVVYDFGFGYQIDILPKYIGSEIKVSYRYIPEGTFELPQRDTKIRIPETKMVFLGLTLKFITPRLFEKKQ